MQQLKLRTLLNSMGAIAVWVALSLIFGDNTGYMLVLGVFAAAGIGLGTYWWGKRFQQEEQQKQ